MQQGQQHRSYYDDEIGLDALDDANERAKDLFLLKVQYRIEEWIIEGDNSFNFTDVMLLGESANDDMFQEALFKAVSNRTGQREGDFVLHLDDDLRFIASKGAAEMTKRILEARAGL